MAQAFEIDGFPLRARAWPDFHF
ncbi:hypothetical protein CCACVL1_03159 [Corchorus capsularis]|uniref:Uncharacterized protein n=1 Tax=Corchorus capsularis TaxID=210143 RepID=A0A1R3K209_COCAP|nr:hypothetical protein CCACVL1_03159 [Corchorus capsularis]